MSSSPSRSRSQKYRHSNGPLNHPSFSSAAMPPKSQSLFRESKDSPRERYSPTPGITYSRNNPPPAAVPVGHYGSESRSRDKWARELPRQSSNTRPSSYPAGPERQRSRAWRLHNTNPQERSVRKEAEKECGGFDWSDGLELTLLSAIALFGIDRELEHRAKIKAEEELKQEMREGGPMARTGGRSPRIAMTGQHKNRKARGTDTSDARSMTSATSGKSKGRGGLWREIKEGVGSLVESNGASNIINNRHRRGETQRQKRSRICRRRSLDSDSEVRDRTRDWAHEQSKTHGDAQKIYRGQNALYEEDSPIYSEDEYYYDNRSYSSRDPSTARRSGSRHKHRGGNIPRDQ